MPREYCKGCNERFFTDDLVDFGNKFCSYCLPKVRQCEICDSIKLLKRKTPINVKTCDECALKYHSFPNIYLILRYKTFERDNFTCRYCGRSPINDASVLLHCDHVFPRSKGGEDKLDNFVTACAECNSGKMDVMLNDYIMAQIHNRGAYGNNQEVKK